MVCKGCTDRQAGCHSTCERYIQEAEELQEKKEKIRKARYEYGQANSQAIESVLDRKKRGYC